jgi:hypothetical protein
MSGTLSGNITSVVTLTPAHSSVSVVGTVNAYGHIGTYSINYNNTLTPINFSAALFGPGNDLYTVNNSGLIESHATTATFFDAGIFLAEAGTVVNAGSIIAASGVAIDGVSNSSGALVVNTRLIEGTVGVGAALFTGGMVQNSGTITGANSGVIFDTYQAGTVTNTNTGTITSAQRAVQLNGGGVVSNAGLISGTQGGINEQGAGTGIVLNSGLITQTGTTIGSYGGYAAVNFDEYHTAALGDAVSNASGGVIHGQYGVKFDLNGSYSSPGSMTDTVMNAGLIQGTSLAAIVDWAGTLLVGNAGSIISAQHALGTNTAIAGIVAGNVGGVDNTIGGVISGDWGIRLNSGEVINQGSIAGWTAPTGTIGSYAGIYIMNGGTLLNEAGGHVTGASGIRVNGGGVDNYVSNAGVIGAAKGAGVYLYQGGLVTNSGTIIGPHHGVVATVDGHEAAAVRNSGLISSTTNTFVKNGTTKYGSAIDIETGGQVTNTSAGTVVGGIGVYMGSALGGSSVSNAGLIEGTYKAGIVLGTVTGVQVSNSGTVSGLEAGVYGKNSGDIVLNTGLIESSLGTGVALQFGGTLVDSGSIAGGGGAVYLGGGADELILQAGARLSGSVIAASPRSAVLDLASSGSVGTLDMGGTFGGFNEIIFETGAQWTLAGSVAELAAPGTVIAGLGAGDALIVEGFTATSHTLISQGGGIDVLALSNGVSTININLSGPYSQGALNVTDVAGGTEIAICYLRGTRILTPTGEVPVETLGIGDYVVTRFGGIQPVKWIGRQRHKAVAGDKGRMPVRVLQGALGPNQPARDLYVSPGHGLLVGDRLVLARLLVNGVTVRQDWAPDLVEYYQIELDAHDCIVAEGAFAETYADIGDLRAQFDNAGEFHALYPDYLAPEELELCARRPEKGEALAAALLPVIALTEVEPGRLRGWLDRVTPPHKIEGWAQDEANPELPVLLEVLLDGLVIGEMLACEFRADLAAEGIGDGRHGFAWRTGAVLPPDALSRVHVRRKQDGAALPNVVPLAGDGGPKLRLVG